MEESQSVEVQADHGASWRRAREDFLALTKARLSILVVLTAAFGYLAAAKSGVGFTWSTMFHMLFGTVLAAFGAAVFNQLMEVEADARMRRTSERPLPANRMPRALAFVIGWLLCAFGIVHLGMKVNVLAAGVAGATLLIYLFVYTPMKRTSSFNTVVGAVSGALPPLIGWVAGEGALLSAGAAFLFGLLFLWQLPHFAAINWMYREEYARGGFRMWSDEDETGARTARIALFFSLLLALLGILFPLGTPVMAAWGAAGGGGLGLVMAWLAFRFLRSGERRDARTLFFYTLIYLPLVMAISYIAWRG